MARIRFFVKAAGQGIDSTVERDYPNAAMSILIAYVQSDRRWNGRDTVVQDPDIENPPGVFTTPPTRKVRVNHTDAEALKAYSAWVTEQLVKDAMAYNRAQIKAVKDAEAQAAADAAEVAAPEVTPQ
jgi:hypothetical protein